jgi:tetratricopeptide (TPR) repeat protein
MHYNLGVFYSQNKEFDRATAEFEKAIEVNPDDASSYFNLGYIYAEHLQNRPKAVANFRQFLKLAKRDDKDADWAKRYILTWQTWEGKTPIN